MNKKLLLALLPLLLTLAACGIPEGGSPSHVSMCQAVYAPPNNFKDCAPTITLQTARLHVQEWACKPPMPAQPFSILRYDYAVGVTMIYRNNVDLLAGDSTSGPFCNVPSNVDAWPAATGVSCVLMYEWLRC